MQKNDTPVSFLWERLCSVNQVEQDIRFGEQQAYGGGTVDVTSSPAMIIWSEKGHWQPPSGPRFSFTNTYYWKLLPVGQVEIGHLRLGKDQPVKLVELTLTGAKNIWKSHEPHLCEEDTYAAEVTLMEKKILLSWDIRGPIKRQVLRYTYF